MDEQDLPRVQSVFDPMVALCQVFVETDHWFDHQEGEFTPRFIDTQFCLQRQSDVFWPNFCNRSWIGVPNTGTYLTNYMSSESCEIMTIISVCYKISPVERIHINYLHVSQRFPHHDRHLIVKEFVNRGFSHFSFDADFEDEYRFVVADGYFATHEDCQQASELIVEKVIPWDSIRKTMFWLTVLSSGASVVSSLIFPFSICLSPVCKKIKQTGNLLLVFACLSYSISQFLLFMLPRILKQTISLNLDNICTSLTTVQIASFLEIQICIVEQLSLRVFFFNKPTKEPKGRMATVLAICALISIILSGLIGFGLSYFYLPQNHLDGLEACPDLSKSDDAMVSCFEVLATFPAIVSIAILLGIQQIKKRNALAETLRWRNVRPENNINTVVYVPLFYVVTLMPYAVFVLTDAYPENNSGSINQKFIYSAEIKSFCGEIFMSLHRVLTCLFVALLPFLMIRDHKTINQFDKSCN